MQTTRYAHNIDAIVASRKLQLKAGSHNQWHTVFRDRFTNRESCDRAGGTVATAGIRPCGLVAPTYFWHPMLYQLLEQRGYRYCSCTVDPATPVPDDLMLRIEMPSGESYLVSPRQCAPPGMPIRTMIPFELLQLPKPDDIGEIMEILAQQWAMWRWRRELRRFLGAYREAYLSWFRRHDGRQGDSQ